MSFMGWLGATLLAFCGLPELVKAFRAKQCTLSWGFLSMWGLGEVFTIIPVVAGNLGNFLVMNYTVNLFIISVLIYYKLKVKP